MHRDHSVLMHYFFIIIIIFVLSISSLATAQQRHFNVSLGSSLTPTKDFSWLSKSGLYAFGFYRRGNGYSVGVFLAGIPEKTVVWTANRDDPPVSANSTLLFTAPEGRLVLQTAQYPDTDITADDIVRSASYASMLDTGNFVLYDSDGVITWQSFAHPTDTLLPTQHLATGLQLISSASKADQSTGTFGLYMQPDGNLVQYPKDDISIPTAYWASNTYGMGDRVNLTLDEDGNLYFVNANGFNVHNITDKVYATRGTIYLLRIDWDGLFRLYSHNLGPDSSWSVLFRSSDDRCAPKGLCGLNSFCVLNDQEPECKCLPGFAPAIQGNWTSGCRRNFITQSCNNKGKKYSIRAEDNTIWEEGSYSVLSTTSKEDCSKACLDDCTCEAALYKDGKCKMQKLPLRYGRRSSKLENSNVVFIKVEETTESSTESSLSALPTRAIVGVTVGTSALVVLVVGFCILCIRKEKNTDRDVEDDLDQLSGMPTRFSYEALKRATEEFQRKLGEGGFGAVFEGTLVSGEKVAAKRLDALGQGKKEFLAEVKTIGSIHHINLVRLVGFCAEKLHRILVYEFMCNGSLDKWIFNRIPQQPALDWQTRRIIILDIAKGLAYLHEECRQRIVHLDIKPQNILLDVNLRAKISDFGLSKLLDRDQSQVVTTMRGTPGYLAPELSSTIVTEKADVYSFGIVVMEVVCGRKNLDRSQSDGCMHLFPFFMIKVEEDCLIDLVDKDSEDMQLHGEEVVQMMRVAVWCLQNDYNRRPSMSTVVKVLEGTMEFEASLTAVTREPEEQFGGATTSELLPSVLSGPR